MAMAVVGFILVAGTEGLMGIVELPGFVGNLLSYTRIAVIGVVGVILGEIINEFLRPSPTQGFLALIVLPIYLGLHAANCAIAMFEALVQGGRLNIVEFRSKFFHGGGVLFAPFAMRVKRK
jgi:V/A-type H+-transporting ATPase subunit I